MNFAEGIVPFWLGKAVELVSEDPNICMNTTFLAVALGHLAPAEFPLGRQNSTSFSTFCMTEVLCGCPTLQIIRLSPTKLHQNAK